MLCNRMGAVPGDQSLNHATHIGTPPCYVTLCNRMGEHTMLPHTWMLLCSTVMEMVTLVLVWYMQ